MKNIILIAILFLATSTFAQTGAHTTTSLVSNIFVSQDETKFLSLSGTEMVLWDNNLNKVIWVKKLADLGLGNAIIYDPIVKVDPFLKYMLISDKSTFKCLVNLNSFQVTRWNYDIHGFVNDGRVAVIEYVFNNKKNSHKAYLLNLDNGEKELMADKMNSINVYDKGNDIEIVYNDKTPYDYDYSKSKLYNLSTKSFTKINQYTKYNSNYGNYFVKFTSGEKTTIQTTDATGKQISQFAIKNQIWGIGVPDICYVSEKNPHAYVLEHCINTAKERISYLCVYDIMNGNIIKKVELHDTSDSAKLIARAETKKQNQIEDEKARISNSPENVLKRRLYKVQGYNNYVYNTKTKGVYLVVPDKPLYEGNLVQLNALNDDPKFNMEVYEKLENLENSALYITTKLKPKSCSHCNGKGSISNSYTRTVADYEYTTGKKLIETNTRTNSCSNCGGCGLTPNY